MTTPETLREAILDLPKPEKWSSNQSVEVELNVLMKLIQDSMLAAKPEKDTGTNVVGFSRGDDGVPTNFEYIYEYAEGFNLALDVYEAAIKQLCEGN